MDYDALSYRFDNLITVHEGDCYIGQPFSGYALRGDSPDEDIIMIGVHIKKETFFREYLPALSTDPDMFRFFLDPQRNKFSDEFIHLSFEKTSPVRALLEMMAVEYANKRDDTQFVLKPMTMSLFMLIARQYRLNKNLSVPKSLSAQILQYVNACPEAVTLKEVAAHFSYHPNYISTLLRKDVGKTFSEIILEKRMSKAVILLKRTSLSIEEISVMLGYSNTSNFYKAFREYFHISPREYVAADADNP